MVMIGRAMSAKILLYGEAGHCRISSGLDGLADAAMLTLGPRGRMVLLERESGAPALVNSGVIVARSIELERPFENMGAQLAAALVLDAASRPATGLYAAGTDMASARGGLLCLRLRGAPRGLRPSPPSGGTSAWGGPARFVGHPAAFGRPRRAGA
jgi:hypothetical protein